MKKEKSIIPEEIRRQLQAYEAPFEQGDWEDMSILLDQNEKKTLFYIPYNCYLRIKNIIKSIKNNIKSLLMITLTLSAIISLWWMNPSITTTDLSKTTIEKTVELQSSSDVKASVARPFNTNKNDQTGATKETNNQIFYTNNKSFSKLSNKNLLQDEIDLPTLDQNNTLLEATLIGESKTAEIQKEQIPSTEQIKEEESGETPQHNDSLIKRNSRIYKKVYRQEWVPAVYETTNHGVSEIVDDFWIGLHYSTQGKFLSETFDHSGFNMQFMSGNIFKQQNKIGFYAGLDFGVLFNGRSENENIILNTLNGDIGITRISNRTYDFLGRFHAEIPDKIAVPYLTGFAGPRMHATGQYIEALLPYRDQESSSYTNIKTSTTLAYGLGLGIRWKLNKRISFDTRYEYIATTGNASTYDLQNTNFDASRGSFDQNLMPLAPDYGMLKIGFIFNLSTARTTKKLVQEGYYKETYFDSLDVDPADENRIYLPCPTYKPCDCESEVEKAIIEYRRNNPCYENNERNDTNPGNIRIPKRQAPRIYVPPTPKT